MIFVYSIFSLLFIIIFFRYFALQFKLADLPNHRKIHKGAVPVIGGISIYINLHGLQLCTSFSYQIISSKFQEDKALLQVNLTLLYSYKISRF